MIILSQLLPINQCLSILSIIRAILKRYPNSKILLENELDRQVKSPYNYEINDPERSNADITSLWLLSSYMNSYCPFIKEYIPKIVNENLNEIENYNDYLEKYDDEFLFKKMFNNIPKTLSKKYKK